MSSGKTKRKTASVIFVLVGIGIVFAVFMTTDEWPRRLHAVLVGAINIAAAVYLLR
jgi:uncharacterized membrane protein